MIWLLNRSNSQLALSSYADFLFDSFWNISNTDWASSGRWRWIRQRHSVTFIFLFFFFSSTSEHQSHGCLKASICVEGSLLVGRCIDSEWSNWLWSIQFCPPAKRIYGWMDLDVLNTDVSIVSCRLRQNRLHPSRQVGAAAVASCFYSASFFPQEESVFFSHVSVDPAQRDPERDRSPGSSHNGC